MNITQQKIDELNAVLNVEVKEADYVEQVEGALKKYQKNAKVQGFRPGKVPMAMVKKMYGPSIKVDEINKLVSESLQKYVVDNKLEVIGQPLPKENTGVTYDWDNQSDFSFSYDLGIVPEFEITLNEKVKFTSCKINIDEALVDKYVSDIAKRYGKMTAPEISSVDDMLYVEFTELDTNGGVKEGGVSKMTSLNLVDVNKTAAEQLAGKKKDDEIVLDLSTLFSDSTKLASVLGVNQAVVAVMSKSFKVKVLNISKLQEAELNQELFDKLYGAGTVNSIEEFRAKVKAESAEALANQELTHLQNNIIQYLLNTVNISLPDAFIKRWLVAASEKPTTMEAVEKDYHHYQKGMKWQLIESKLIKENDLKVEFSELEEKAKELIRSNFRQYGQSIDDEQLAPIVLNVLKRDEERRNIYDALYTEKIVQVVKNKCHVEEKQVSIDEFSKLVHEQNNNQQ